MKLLLESGADPNTVSDQKVTPLDLATQADQSIEIEALHKVGAKLYQDTEAFAEHRFNQAENNGERNSINPPDQNDISVVPLDRANSALTPKICAEYTISLWHVHYYNLLLLGDMCIRAAPLAL